MMKTRLFFLLVLVCSYAAQAQISVNVSKGSRTDVITKRIIRTVFMADTVDYSLNKLRSETSDTALAETLTKLVMGGKYTAYDTGNLKLNRTLSGKDVRKARFGNYEMIRYYQVLEELTYNTKHGITDIKILAIAPMTEIINDKNEHMGRYAVYFVKYDAVKGLLDSYEHQHPNCSLARAVWNDFFTEQESLKSKNHD